VTTTLIYLLLAFAMASIILMVVIILRTKNAPMQDIKGRLDLLEKSLDRTGRHFREEMAMNREEMAQTLHNFNESLLHRMAESSAQNIQKLDKIDDTVDRHMKILQEDNSRKLEQIRGTVDEKLHDTLERRLGESFKLVSDRLEMVQKGLGEMKTLASGVGDLKKVLTNIKTRGSLGEIQLHNLLEQILAPEQYEKNVATKRDSSARVEFAIRLPGRDRDPQQVLWLPIDAKFPQEDYLRLVEAQEQGNAGQVEEASRQLDRVIRDMAKAIRDKYLDPPHTTDFGIMFLPTEGLYAEVLRRSGLFEILQRDFKVVVTGPTTLAALLNSLQMGFRTLAIEKRSSEVWTVLGAVKTEFAHFGAILEKTQKKLQEASNTVETAAVRSRAIERKLRDVQDMTASDSPECLAEASAAETDRRDA
jgi:DNA recombination protein RmuC